MSDRDVARRITERLNESPVFRELYAELVGREPRYRYWETPDGWRFHYTTERMGDGKYHSAQYQPTGKGSRSGRKAVTRWEVRRELTHATRRGAKARALKLYYAHVKELEAKARP